MWKPRCQARQLRGAVAVNYFDDVAVEPDELLLVFSAGLLAALSPPLGVASLLPEPDPLDPEEPESEPDVFVDESESAELDELLEDERDAEPLRESLL